MQFSFFKKDTKKIVAIFDVGSDSVGVALVSYSADEKIAPRILKTIRKDIVFREKLDFLVFMDDMIKTLKDVSHDISICGSGAPTKIFVVLSSPWYITENRRISVSENNPFIFTEKLSNEIVNRELFKLKKLHHQKYGGHLDNVDIVEKEIVQVLLNGYPINNPINQKARSVDMNMVVTLSSHTCVGVIRSTLASVFHHIPIFLSSSMSAMYLVVREKYPKIDSYMMVDIGGELTDLSIVSGGVPRNLVSFPYGRQTLFRDLQKILKKDIKNTRSMFSLYQDGTLADKEKSSMENALKIIQNSWTEEFAKSIKSIPEPRVVPTSVFIVVNKDVHPWFLKTFSEPNDKLRNIFKNDCVVSGLKGPDFLGLCRVEDGACDPILMIEALAIRRKNIF